MAAQSTRTDALHRKQSWNHLGLCLTTIGDSAGAVQALQEALKLDPNYREAYASARPCPRSAPRRPLTAAFLQTWASATRRWRRRRPHCRPTRRR